MNELHKYATFSVDLLGKPSKINSMFSMGRARIFYKGINRNRSIIAGTVAEKLAYSIPGTPIIGTYNYDTNDFEGHEPNPSAYGFVPLNPNYSWVKTEDGKEYLEVDVVIWDGRFEEAQSILTEEKSLSMELNPKTIRGTFERIENKTYYNITSAEFAGITVLGDDVEPCFEDAGFIAAYSHMVNQYALYVENIQKNDEGGKSIMENITEIVEPEVTTETVVETEVTEEVIETPEVIETEVEEVVEAETTEEETVETEIIETVEEATEETEFAADEEDDDEDDDDVCPDCGENPCVCKSACGNKKKDYAALEAELAEIQAKYESLENKYNDTLNSLNQYTRKEKLEIISKFSTKLENEELIETLTNEVDNRSIEEIKSELGQALVEEQLVLDDTEDEAEATNFSLNINLNNNGLGNSAWDLVKRHKESK